MILEKIDDWVEPRGRVRKQKGSRSSAAGRLCKLALLQQNAALQEIRKLQDEHEEVRVTQQVRKSSEAAPSSAFAHAAG
jgi:hypothetical protein